MVLPKMDYISHLIEQGELVEARKALKTILLRDSRNVEAWWLYARIAETDSQRFQILDAFTKLPTNAYTARARAWLAKLPYQSSSTHSADIPNPSPKQQGLMHTYLMAAIGAIAIGAIIFAVVSLLRSSATASASQASIVEVSNKQGASKSIPAVNRVIITVAPPPTLLPEATSTPFPKRLLAPTWTPVATATKTITPQPVDLSELVPGMNQKFNDQVNQLYKNAQLAMDQAPNASNSSDAESKLTAATNAIQTLRNTVLATSLHDIPLDSRREVISPAHQAFVTYANTVLYWVDLQTEANRLKHEMSVAATADLAVATANYQQQYQLVLVQAAKVKSTNSALQAALGAYDVYAAELLLAGKMTGQAKITSSRLQDSITLGTGDYTVILYAGLVRSGLPGVWLVSSTTGERLPITVAVSSPDSWGGTVHVQSGEYYVQVENVVWWAVAFDLK